MLSVLIPTYNYNAYPLVLKLSQQSESESIDYEIIVLDDCSTEIIVENSKINEMPSCLYKKLEENIGRSAIRNKLASIAKYNTLLFLDVDTIPIHDNFIANYLSLLNNDYDIIYGGIRYQPDRPKAEELLRWKYGNEREALTVEKRELKPYISFLTLNFIIKKQIFGALKFDEDIPNLRHEDTLFALEAKKLKLKIKHTENPVYHLGLDTSDGFLEKSTEAVDALNLFIKQKLITANDTSISKAVYKVKKIGLLKVGALSFSFLKKTLEKNLKSSSPSLFLFDIYRLGYFCSIINKNKF